MKVEKIEIAVTSAGFTRKCIVSKLAEDDVINAIVQLFTGDRSLTIVRQPAPDGEL